MPRLTFYHQKRRDEATRTGIEIDDQPAQHLFSPGADEEDPVLLWYLDLSLESDQLPAEPQLALDWLHSHDSAIQQLVREVARRMPAGIDPDTRPLIERLPLNGVTVTITASASRRAEAARMREILEGIAEQLPGLIRKLGESAAVSQP